MIKNEKQYRITKKALDGWQLTHEQLINSGQSGSSDWLHNEQLLGVKEQIRQLKAQIKEYEDTISGKITKNTA
jgi:hypothetical protein